MEDRIAKIKDSISRSGHRLHIEVVETLRKNGWETTVSPHYFDDTAVAREVDILARKRIEVLEPITKKVLDRFDVELFIECKYLRNDYWFWFDEISKDALFSAVQEGSFIPGFDDFLRSSMLPKISRFQYSSVARLYGSTDANDGKIFEAISQSIKSLHYFERRRSGRVYRIPIVVYKGPEETGGIFRCDDPLNTLDASEIKERFGYFLNFAHSDSDRAYLVDFVRLSKLQDYCDALSADIVILKDYFFSQFFA